MLKPSLGWQSWSPPFPKWHGFPRWDYSPFKVRELKNVDRKTPKRITKVRYWCSWYAYGWNIDHQKIIATLNAIKQSKLPLTHILIDDGWTTWGDWQSPNLIRFPNFTTTVGNIHSFGLKAGLWLAPFLASKKSHLFKTHPEWFVKYRGKHVQGLKTMPIWESLLPQQYLLNLELPQVKDYLSTTIDLAISKWHFDLLKLDFLYAVYFNPHHKSDKVPHSQIDWLLNYIKHKHPHVHIIACGSPFAPALGLSDTIRIAKDTALPPVVPKIINYVTYVVRVKMLAQKLSLSHLLKGIEIDPDVRMFSLDSSSTSTIWDTISTNVLGIGDDLTKLSPPQLKKAILWLTNHSSR